MSEARLIRSVNREISVYDDYDAFLKLAHSPDMRFVFSNTTEAGISYHSGDKFDDAPAVSGAGPQQSTDDVARLLSVGADKIGVNSAAIARPDLLDEIADRFGAQVLVLSLDVKRVSPDRRGASASGFVVTTHGGRTETTLDALEWAREAVERGAGELLVNSIDADGTKQGFDLELVRLMRQVAAVPVIASGGAGALEHFAPAVQAGADAVLAASVFHSGQLTVGQVKDAMASEGIEVRR